MSDKNTKGGVLSFDFSDVKISGSGGDISSLATGVPLYATIDGVTSQEFNGTTKFVVQHTIYPNANDESVTVEFRSYIGPRHQWLLAQYLTAAGEDFRTLSGQPLDANSLDTLFKGTAVNLVLKDNNYQKDGVTKTSKQINSVRPILAG